MTMLLHTTLICAYAHAELDDMLYLRMHAL